MCSDRGTKKLLWSKHKNHFFFLRRYQTMDLNFISISRSSRDKAGGFRLWGRKEMCFLGRSFFWDLGWKLLCEHWSCALITVIKRWDLATFPSLCSALPHRCLEGPVWGGEVVMSLFSVSRSSKCQLEGLLLFSTIRSQCVGEIFQCALLF